MSASLDPARILRPPPPPSRSVLFGGAGNCVSRASVVVWVPFTVDSGSLVLHLWGEFSAHSFEASVFSSFPSFFFYVFLILCKVAFDWGGAVVRIWALVACCVSWLVCVGGIWSWSRSVH